MRLGLIAVVAAGCGFPPIEDERIYQGRYVELHADPIFPVCPESLATADAFVDVVAGLLELSPPHITYYLYADSPGSCHALGTDEADCAVGATVRAGNWIQFHELVHVVARPWGRPPAFLQEGLAEGLGTPYPQLTAAERRDARLEDAIESVAFFTGDDVIAAYEVSGDFAIYLLRRFGTGPVRRLYGSLLYHADTITIRRAFADELGVAFEQLLADWRAFVPPPDATLPRDAVRCAAPVVAPIAPDSYAVDETAECVGGPTTAGAFLAQPTVHALELTTPGVYDLRASVGGPGTALSGILDGCGTGDVPADLFALASLPQTRIVLAPRAAGRHTLELRTTINLETNPTPAPLSWSLSRLGDQAATCATAPILAAPVGRWVMVHISQPTTWPGSADDPALGAVAASWLRIDPLLGTRALLLNWAGTSTARENVRICAGPCDAPTGCIVLAGDGPAQEFQPVDGAPIVIEMHAATDVDTHGFAVSLLR